MGRKKKIEEPVMEVMTVEELYASYEGEIDVDNLQKMKKYFSIACAKCNSDQVAIMTETDDDGCCETCSSPYARATIKCANCGNAVSIR